MVPDQKTHSRTSLCRPVVTGPALPITPLGTGRTILRSSRILVLATALLAVVACSQTVTGPAPDPPTTSSASADAEATPNPALRTPAGAPPNVDTTIASVPLESVVFDTFDGGFLRLSEAGDRAIEGLRYRIKPVYEPRYDPVEGGAWLQDDDLVIGFVSNTEAFAYPVKILNLHEIVNDVIDGAPVLVSYCPLCASGVVYSRELDGQVLIFGNTSALFESDLVMYDHQTGSYWFQVIGEAIVGPLTGKRLEPLPSMTTTWGRWKALHAGTRVLSRDLGLLPSFGNPYARDPFAGYAERVNRGQFAFPVTDEKLDDRLRPGDMVYAVQVGDAHKAYRLTDRRDEVINDEVDGERLVIVFRSEGPTAAACFGALNGNAFSFELNQGVLQDLETGTSWDDGGEAISGPMAGTWLTAVPSRTSFWFSLVGSLPGIELHP